ncbi:MAG TPA: hypothetical protein VGM56_28030 [Byssovorax sp.]|jgi:hypothetical protein
MFDRIGNKLVFGVACAAAALIAGCAPPQDSSPEDVGQSQAAVFVNGGFEAGAPNAPPSNWTVETFINNGITVQSPQTRAGLDLVAGGKSLTTNFFSLTGPLTQTDPDLGAGASLRWPRFGNQCAMVNFHSSTNFTSGGTNNGKNVNGITQTMTIGAGDVDPADGQIHVRFTVAPVLANPAHAANQQPYYFVELSDLTAGTTLYQDFNLSGNLGVPWKTVNGGTNNEIDYTDWQLVDIAPGAAAMGHQVKLEVLAAGCSLGGHFGEIYVDGVGPTVPGLFVSGTGPSQVNACGNITYTLTYENGGATPVTGVQVTFNTPPQTTYQSISAPGLVCTEPAVGMTGAVNCTVPGVLGSGASGSFQVTVNVGCAATGTITAGNYFVQGTGVPPLLGPHVNTLVGCTADSQCAAADWCNEASKTCTPKLPNGTSIPTDPGHNPTLNGVCTAAAGTAVCASGVCDPADNKCGDLNGDGPCTAANGGTVCRSGVCDPDLKCGYAVGDGPCTVATGGTVCRSGACSVSGVCEPAGGCDVDADCSGGNWCDETTHTCTPKLANGQTIPNDPPHTNPTLNATCSNAAATLVCASAVCDTNDNECGYANGDGPCTAADGGVVCRSGACSANGGVCVPAGGCAVDSDCGAAQWCNTAQLQCVAKLPNSTPIPTVTGHAPPLTGTCTVGAGSSVCTSGVCDMADNECGYANGDGPCDMTTGGTVCRSGMCSNSGTCVAAGGCNSDADCATGNWCDEAQHTCTPQLDNGQSVPTDPGHSNPTLDGTCTVAAATLTCKSGVCDDADNECGYANGDGPCTPANGGTVCRSGTCSGDGTCQPGGGCNVDADCGASSWCNESMHVCEGLIKNGDPVATDPGHSSPTLDGTCTDAAGALVCASAVCDTHDNGCGYANGDGPCTAADGGSVCRSTACATSGANAGSCVACTDDTTCSGATKVCDTTKNTCVQCTASDASACTGATPTCDTTTETCVACSGDFGSNGTSACPTSTDPWCATSGSTQGQCGKCTQDADCDGPTHAGPKCDVMTGACGPATGCTTDADCNADQWCNAEPMSTGACVAKLPNGQHLPSDPMDVATCTMAVGARVCSSGVCDTSDDTCGFANGDGPCTNTGECRDGECDMSTMTCLAPTPTCTTDADCPTGEYCAGTMCAVKLPDGSTCDTSAECQSDSCVNSLCSSGSGFISLGGGCATDGGSSTDGGAAASLFGLMLVAAGLKRRRRAA